MMITVLCKDKIQFDIGLISKKFSVMSDEG